MIELGSFKNFRKNDFIAIILLAVLWALLTSLVNLPNTSATFMFSLFITTMFMTFTAFLIRKFFAVTLFYLLGAIITIPINNLGGLGLYKVPILLIAGLVFEVFFLLLKIEIKNIPLDVILGAAFSNASIPWTILLLSRSSIEILPSVVNFSLSAFLIGIIGSLITFLIWYHIKSNKNIIKFEYSV